MRPRGAAAAPRPLRVHASARPTGRARARPRAPAPPRASAGDPCSPRAASRVPRAPPPRWCEPAGARSRSERRRRRHRRVRRQLRRVAAPLPCVRYATRSAALRASRPSASSRGSDRLRTSAPRLRPPTGRARRPLRASPAPPPRVAPARPRRGGDPLRWQVRDCVRVGALPRTSCRPRRAASSSPAALRAAVR